MKVSQPTQLRCLTREQWVRFVSRQIPPDANPPTRRSTQRRRLEYGIARLSYKQAGRSISYVTTLLEISVTGLMIKTRRLVPGETELRVQMLVEEAPLAVVGTVIHSTQTVGGFKTGVRLMFPAGGR
jgi:hypothetical protein